MPSRIADPPRFFYFVTINAFFGKRIFSIYLTAKTVTPDGEIVAHQGLKEEHRDSPVAEIMMGVVDPRFRGRGLFEKMKKISFEYIKETGVYGLFVEAVTVHAYSQNANRALGARETGILLGFIPKDSEFIAFGKLDSRQSAVLLYNRLSSEPERVVYLPTHHQTIIQKIYDYGDFRHSYLRASIGLSREAL
jgi:hypothetical protein